jgi:hypothetical protein
MAEPIAIRAGVAATPDGVLATPALTAVVPWLYRHLAA